jgi:hypothetical protein
MKKIIKKTLIFFSLFLCFLILSDMFFDRYDLQSPVVIKFQPVVVKRHPDVKKSEKKELPKPTATPTPTPTSKPQSKIQPFRKYLTDIGARNREIALDHLRSKGFSEDEITAYDNIFKKESGYLANAVNEIGCVGIPQDCLGRMKCSLENTEEAVKCQIDWAVGYVKGRYGNAINAWEHSVAKNYY